MKIEVDVVDLTALVYFAKEAFVKHTMEEITIGPKNKFDLKVIEAIDHCSLILENNKNGRN